MSNATCRRLHLQRRDDSLVGIEHEDVDRRSAGRRKGREHTLAVQTIENIVFARRTDKDLLESRAEYYFCSSAWSVTGHQLRPFDHDTPNPLPSAARARRIADSALRSNAAACPN